MVRVVWICSPEVIRVVWQRLWVSLMHTCTRIVLCWLWLLDSRAVERMMVSFCWSNLLHVPSCLKKLLLDHFRRTADNWQPEAREGTKETRAESCQISNQVPQSPDPILVGPYIKVQLEFCTIPPPPCLFLQIPQYSIGNNISWQ